jgi:hypothetical protein
VKSRGRFVVVLLALAVAACSQAQRSLPAPTPVPTPAGTGEVSQGDISFGGYAFVDANGNGDLDPTDLPLEGARFIVVLGRGQSSSFTNASGSASIMFGLSGSAQFSATLFMEPPDGSGYTLVGPDQVVIPEACCAGGSREFLFAPPFQERDEPVLTPEIVFQQKEDLIGQNITVRGTAQALWPHCTEIVCPEQNPCCNACWCGVGFWADVSEGKDIALSAPDIDCSGNECLITCQPFEFGVTYVVTGSLREEGGSSGLKAKVSSLYLDVVDFKISD